MSQLSDFPKSVPERPERHAQLDSWALQSENSNFTRRPKQVKHKTMRPLLGRDQQRKGEKCVVTQKRPRCVAPVVSDSNGFSNWSVFNAQTRVRSVWVLVRWALGSGAAAKRLRLLALVIFFQYSSTYCSGKSFFKSVGSDFRTLPLPSNCMTLVTNTGGYERR